MNVKKTSLPNRYTFIENNYLTDIIDILKEENIEIKTQIVNQKM